MPAALGASGSNLLFLADLRVGCAQHSLSRSAAKPFSPASWIMKLSLALALAAFLGFGAVSTAFAQDAMGGITSSNGQYTRSSSY
jgi:hypothetical protein